MTTFGGEAVERTIRQFGLAERVKRLAYVPDADLPALYSGAAAVAIVSLYEGFGMPALEALACGATLVASNRGSLPEIVGDAGVIVDPLDVTAICHGLERAIGDSVLAGQLRERGPRRAAAFTWSAAASATLDVLQRAAGTGPPVPAPFPAS